MTSETAKYMQMLRRYLRKLPDDEIDDIVEFYSEYLADAGIDTKAEIEQELGTPRQLALKILADHSIKEEAEDQRVVSKTKIKTTWLIILALLATPATLIIGLILLTAAAIFTGLSLLFTNLGTGLFYLGIGLLGLGLLLIVIPLVWGCSVWIVKACTRLVQHVYYRYIKKEAAK